MTSLSVEDQQALNKRRRDMCQSFCGGLVIGGSIAVAMYCGVENIGILIGIGAVTGLTFGCCIVAVEETQRRRLTVQANDGNFNGGCDDDDFAA